MEISQNFICPRFVTITIISYRRYRFQAKWRLAFIRHKRGIQSDDEITEVKSDEQSEFDEIYDKFLDLLNASEEFRKAAFKVCTKESIVYNDAQVIREHFHNAGKDVLNLAFEFQP